MDEKDIEFIEFLKTEEPCMLRRTIKDNLLQYYNVTDVSLSTISRIVNEDLNMSFKRVTRYHHNRFTDQNMAYTQAFIDLFLVKIHINLNTWMKQV